MSWVQIVYLCAEIIEIPLTGFLTRLLSMHWLFVTAVSVFMFASAGCASSGGFGELIAWRTLQGPSGGTLIPAVFSAVFSLFRSGARASPRWLRACWRCWRRVSIRSWEGGSRGCIRGTGCS